MHPVWININTSLLPAAELMWCIWKTLQQMLPKNALFQNCEYYTYVGEVQHTCWSVALLAKAETMWNNVKSTAYFVNMWHTTNHEINYIILHNWGSHSTVVASWTAGQVIDTALGNNSSNHAKIRLISLGCPWSSIALQCRIMAIHLPI